MITFNLRRLGVKMLVLPCIREIQYKNFELVRIKTPWFAHGVFLLYLLRFIKMIARGSTLFFIL